MWRLALLGGFDQMLGYTYLENYEEINNSGVFVKYHDIDVLEQNNLTHLNRSE